MKVRRIYEIWYIIGLPRPLAIFRDEHTQKHVPRHVHCFRELAHKIKRLYTTAKNEQTIDMTMMVAILVKLESQQVRGFII